MFKVTFLHTLVYNQVYTLVPALVYTIKYISVVFYICPFYTSLNCLVHTYTCLYMHIYRFSLHVSTHVCLTILVYITANIYFAKLSYQYVFLDILAYIYLSVHTCLYILFSTFIYTFWIIFIFSCLWYLAYTFFLFVYTICYYYLLDYVTIRH